MRKSIVLILILAAFFGGVWAGMKYLVKDLPSVGGEAIGPEDVMSALDKKFRLDPVTVKYIAASDAYYFAPDPSEVWNLIKDIKPNLAYRPSVFDCDDFAAYFRGELERKWASNGYNHLSLPIITIWAHVQFKDGTDGYHAFNGIIMSNGGVVWIEPQGPWIFRHIKILAISKLTL